MLHLLHIWFLSFFLIPYCVIVSLSKEKFDKSDLTEFAKKEYARAYHSSALKLFKQSIKEGDKTGTPRFFIGLILEAKRKYNESILYYIEAVDRPLKKEYKKAALWKLILYFQKIDNYAGVLEYSAILKKIIGRNKGLEKIIFEADMNVTPLHIEARQKIKKAINLEKKYLVDKKKIMFWKKHVIAIEETARIYEDIAKIHKKYQYFGWKAASYYENLDFFDDAIRVYQWIIEKKNNLKANYKIGVILRKQKKYEDAEKYLMNVINAKNIDKKLKYYAYINMTQVHYGMQSFIQAEKDAKSSLSKVFFKERKKRQSHILYLIKCNSSLQIDQMTAYTEEIKILNTFKKNFYFCYSYIKRKNFFQRNKDYRIITLSNLIRGKWFHLISLTTPLHKQKYNNLAMKYYKDSFLYRLPEDTELEKEKNVANDDKELEGVTIYEEEIHSNFQKMKRKDWCLGELKQVVSFIFSEGNFQELEKLLLNYETKLKIYQDYSMWLSSFYFLKKNYEKASDIYQNIEPRSLEIEKKLLLSYIKLQRWDDFKLELKNYLYSFINLKEEIIQFLNSESSFSELRKKNNFSALLQEIYMLEEENELSKD